MQDPATCSHDSPDQQPGTPCIRCGKLMPGEAPKPATFKAERKSNYIYTGVQEGQRAATETPKTKSSQEEEE